MIPAIARTMTNLAIRYNIVSKDEFEIYQYGFELMVSTFLNLIITVIIGLIIGELTESIIFWFVLALIRSKTGGYHAKTYLKCNFVFIVVLITVLLWVNYSFTYYNYYAISIHHFLYIICIAALCPIENNNKPLDSKQKRINKIISLILGCFSFIISIIMCNSNKRNISALLSVSLVCIAFFVIAGYILGKRGENNE